MLTCKETARLVSEGLDRSLPLRVRMSLRLHLMMCGACASYRRQIEALQNLIQRRFSIATDAEAGAEGCCSQETKDRMIQVLNEHHGKGA